MEALGIAHDGLPDLYWIVLRGLHAVSDRHGIDSPVTREAKQLVSEAASALSRALSNVYDGRVSFSLLFPTYCPISMMLIYLFKQIN